MKTKKNQIVSFSGGKDSTAIAILEPDKPLVFFDTGWGFPGMKEHISKFAPKVLEPRHCFDDLAIKYGWPSMLRRWCTGRKVQALEKNSKGFQMLIGFAKGEEHRCTSKEMLKKKIPPRFPLIERGMTEADAMQLCTDHGYDWGGLYDRIDKRISCYCCPLKGSPKVWFKIRAQYPDLWERMLWLDQKITDAGKNGGFYGYKTVHDLEKRFEWEDKQGELLF